MRTRPNACRRSIYLYRKRNVHYPMFDAFDAPDALTPCPVRAVSTHAPQALVLFNSGFALESAKAFARLLLQCSAERSARVTQAFLRCYAREPSRRGNARSAGIHFFHLRLGTRRAGATSLSRFSTAMNSFMSPELPEAQPLSWSAGPCG